MAKCPMAKCPTVKSPYGKVSLRLKVVSSMCFYDEMSHSKISHREMTHDKFRTVKSPRAH